MPNYTIQSISPFAHNGIRGIGTYLAVRQQPISLTNAAGAWSDYTIGRSTLHALPFARIHADLNGTDSCKMTLLRARAFYETRHCHTAAIIM